MPLFERHPPPVATGSPLRPVRWSWPAGSAGKPTTWRHIEDLAAPGGPPPLRASLFYRMDPALLAGPVGTIEVPGERISVEVEALLALADGLRVTVRPANRELGRAQTADAVAEVRAGARE